MNKLNFTNKNNGDTLEASEWNLVTSKIDELVEASNTGGGNSSNNSGALSLEEDPNDSSKTIIKINNVKVGELTTKSSGTNVNLVGNNNINIEPREATGTGDKKITKDPNNAQGGNIALKPGDDIEFWAHHRGSSKNTEVSVKMLTEIDGEEIPAKLQLNTNDIVITSKDKPTESNITNIVFNKSKGLRGYLKVRAQAIDLRCEDHGGIAIQPKGEDSQHHQNKIKFEHGGGDGLEFGTFNTEKTSIFTEEYRFNENGTILLANRKKVLSDKYMKFKYIGSGSTYVDNGDICYDSSSNLDSEGNERYIVSSLQGFTENKEYSVEELAVTLGDNFVSEAFSEDFKNTSNDQIVGIQTYDYNDSNDEYSPINNGEFLFQVVKSSDVDDTAKFKYLKASDDFYDYITDRNNSITWKDLITAVKYIKQQNPNLFNN